MAKTGSFPTGKSAAQVIRAHVSKCGTKGNRKPSSSNIRTHSSDNRVGGAMGMAGK